MQEGPLATYTDVAEQLGAVKLLLEHRCAEVNQQDKTRGWTPLMRCAQMAHYTHAPYFEVQITGYKAC